MDSHFTFPVSIERFAAYLDGNLTDDEMQEISSLAESDTSLHDILSASRAADELLDGYTETDLPTPSEFDSMDFPLPFAGVDDYGTGCARTELPFADMWCAFDTGYTDLSANEDADIPSAPSDCGDTTDGFDNTNEMFNHTEDEDWSDDVNSDWI